MPFGAGPLTNKLLLERGVDIASPLAAADARLYSQYCGFIDDKQQTDRTIWKEAVLCNSGNLRTDILQAAVVEFHDKVDVEIANYWAAVARNVVTKLGIALLAAWGALLVVAAAMWVVKGRLV